MSSGNPYISISVASIIEEIKASQQNVLKVFEDHQTFVNKSLEKLQQLKTESKVEVVKVKDPLEELKKINEEYKDRELYGYLRNLIIIKITECLSLYESTKISVTFKEIFLKLFNECIQFKSETEHILFNSKSFKESVLKVRDIRWLLLEMEKYPQIFQFTEDDLEVMKNNGASRDNIYLVKKFLKKDGDYEEYFSEEEGGGIKCQYHMTGGKIDGEYKEYYENATKKAIRNYKDGELDGITETWYKNGKRSIYASFKKGLIHGVYNSWYENENPMYETQHQNNIRQGTRIDYYYNGQKSIIRNYINGLQVGEYKCWSEGGILLTDNIYDTNGKLINLKHNDSSGHLDLEKTLIEDDIYELKQYYGTGKLHYKVIMKDGKWNGEYISYWNSGKICTKCSYKNDKLDGEWEYWNEDGTLKEKLIYKDGEKQV